jgi:hypothetical protein
LLALTTVLGLHAGPDGPRTDPHLPLDFGAVALRGVRGRWGRADVTADPAGERQRAAVPSGNSGRITRT